MGYIIGRLLEDLKKKDIKNESANVKIEGRNQYLRKYHQLMEHSINLSNAYIYSH